MKRLVPAASAEIVQKRILTLRGAKVLLDADLAELYGVSTKALNQAVKRNRSRFPRDFMFRLTDAEKDEVVTNCDHLWRLKFAAALPYAFSEQGAIMAANVLNSRKAVAMSVFVVRAFVKMREMLGTTGELARQLKELETKLTCRLDVHETAIVEVLQRIMDILKPAPEPPEPPRKEMGFHMKEDEVPYRIRRAARQSSAGNRTTQRSGRVLS